MEKKHAFILHNEYHGYFASLCFDKWTHIFLTFDLNNNSNTNKKNQFTSWYISLVTAKCYILRGAIITRYVDYSGFYKILTKDTS